MEFYIFRADSWGDNARLLKVGKVRVAPAARFAAKRNAENPELYCVFPFRLASFNRPNADLAINALEHRWARGHAGWRRDDIFMACLGLADQARDNLVARARAHDKGSRFPAFWGPNYDWTPDQDPGRIVLWDQGSLRSALRPMTSIWCLAR